jgi:hypothetical protein
MGPVILTTIYVGTVAVTVVLTMVSVALQSCAEFLKALFSPIFG